MKKILFVIFIITCLMLSACTTKKITEEKLIEDNTYTVNITRTYDLTMLYNIRFTSENYKMTIEIIPTRHLTVEFWNYGYRCPDILVEKFNIDNITKKSFSSSYDYSPVDKIRIYFIENNEIHMSEIK